MVLAKIRASLSRQLLQNIILLLQQRQPCACWEEGRAAPPGKCISTNLLWEAQPGVFAAPQLAFNNPKHGMSLFSLTWLLLSPPVCPWVLPKKQSESYLEERKPEYISEYITEYISAAQTLVTPQENFTMQEINAQYVEIFIPSSHLLENFSF